MVITDLLYITKWWLVFIILGFTFLPLASTIFNNFKDKGYILSKTLSLLFISYTVFILSSLKILKFSTPEILVISFIFIMINLFIAKKNNFVNLLKNNWKIIVVEELIFLIT